MLGVSAGDAGPSGGVLWSGRSSQSRVSKPSHPLIPPWNQPELRRSSTAGMFRHPQHRRARVSGAKGSGVCCAPLELRAEPSARRNERLPRAGGGPGTQNLTPPGTHSEFGLCEYIYRVTYCTPIFETAWAGHAYVSGAVRPCIYLNKILNQSIIQDIWGLGVRLCRAQVLRSLRRGHGATDVCPVR